MNIKENTFFKKKQKDRVIKLALNLTTDPEKKIRREESKCLYCFYKKDIVALRVMTNKKCQLCKSDQIYPSSHTDELCLDCARENQLCKHCCSHVEYKKTKNEDTNFNTRLYKEMVQDIKERATNLVNDPNQKERIQNQLCQCCFYSESSMAGQAFTEKDCEICKEPQQYSSTNTNKVCNKCAESNKICKHCGSLLNYNEN